MPFHSQQPGADGKTEAAGAKPMDKKTRKEILGEGKNTITDAEASVDTSEWSDEDEADIHLADVADMKRKSAKPAKQQ